MFYKIMQTSDNCKEAIRGKDISTLLYDLISTATPHGYEYLLDPIMNEVFRNSKYVTSIGRDKINNVYVTVGKRTKDYETMFSCHMDIVPRGSIGIPGIITPFITAYKNKNEKEKDGLIYGAIKTYKNDSEIIAPSIVGADDKVGVYICLKLIEKGVPGLYVFHVGEEVGCIGSTYSTKHNETFFNGLKRCIAFDRMGYGDVISQQRGRRCASKQFTNEFATTLNLNCPPFFKPFKGDVVGICTDSANYTGIIPECTNLSVGYFNQHSVDEHFDYYWLEHIFIPILTKFDFEKLPTIRKTSDPDFDICNSYSQRTQRNKNYGGTSVIKKTHEIDAFTPFYSCPDWEPQEGILKSATPEGMIRIIESWLFAYGNKESSKILYNLFKEKLKLDKNSGFLYTLRHHTVNTINIITKTNTIINEYNRLHKISKLKEVEDDIELYNIYHNKLKEKITSNILTETDLNVSTKHFLKICAGITSYPDISKRLRKICVRALKDIQQQYKVGVPTMNKKTYVAVFQKTGQHDRDTEDLLKVKAYTIEASTIKEAEKFAQQKFVDSPLYNVAEKWYLTELALVERGA